jgi:predicted DNA-binding transcriptional regulator AlpA
MNAEVQDPAMRLVAWTELEERLSYKRATIRKWMKAGTFPWPHYVNRRPGWRFWEIQEWFDSIKPSPDNPLMHVPTWRAKPR